MFGYVYHKHKRKSLVRIMCYYLNCLIYILSAKPFVSAVDIRLAAKIWVYCVHQHCFKDIFNAIRLKRNHCLKRQLGLEIDDMGKLRCHGRFLNAMMTDGVKYPNLLPRNEHFTFLLIFEVHKRLIHAGVAHTLAQVREEYWILQGRGEAKKVYCNVWHVDNKRDLRFNLLRCWHGLKNKCHNWTPISLEG